MNIIFENKSFVLKEQDNGILHWHFYSGELNLKDYLIVYNYGLKNYENEGYLILATHDENFHFSSETWAFMGNKNTDFSFIHANALVINQLHLRILANFFNKIKKKILQFKSVFK